MTMTQEEAHRLFEYKDGELFRKIGRNNRYKAGTRAGYLVKGTGYRGIEVNNIHYPEHSIIYLMHNGFIPKIVDHINGNKIDNKIENLREVTAMQNAWNAKRSKSNTSGIKGISFRKDRNVWIARLQANAKSIYLGYFKSKNEAEEFLQLAREMVHGNFANHGLKGV
jgi:hypothetical protein